MNLFVFLVVCIGLYFIFSRGYKALKNASIREKMKNTLNTEDQYDKVKKFTKEHKDVDKKEQTITNFTTGGKNE